MAKRRKKAKKAKALKKGVLRMTERRGPTCDACGKPNSRKDADLCLPCYRKENGQQGAHVTARGHAIGRLLGSDKPVYNARGVLKAKARDKTIGAVHRTVDGGVAKGADGLHRAKPIKTTKKNHHVERPKPAKKATQRRRAAAAAEADSQATDPRERIRAAVKTKGTFGEMTIVKGGTLKTSHVVGPNRLELFETKDGFVVLINGKPVTKTKNGKRAQEAYMMGVKFAERTTGEKASKPPASSRARDESHADAVAKQARPKIAVGPKTSTPPGAAKLTGVVAGSVAKQGADAAKQRTKFGPKPRPVAKKAGRPKRAGGPSTSRGSSTPPKPAAKKPTKAAARKKAAAKKANAKKAAARKTAAKKAAAKSTIPKPGSTRLTKGIEVNGKSVGGHVGDDGVLRIKQTNGPTDRVS